MIFDFTILFLTMSRQYANQSILTLQNPIWLASNCLHFTGKCPNFQQLDYYFLLFVDVTKRDLYNLQMAQNSLGKAIAKTSKYQDITPILHSLHWLPVEQRIQFKMCLIFHKALHLISWTISATCSPLIQHTSNYCAWSTYSTLTHAVPCTWTVLDSRAFSVTGSKLLNRLPCFVCYVGCLLPFRSKLKTYLDQFVFLPLLDSLVIWPIGFWLYSQLEFHLNSPLIEVFMVTGQ